MTAARPLAIGLVQLAMGTDTGENVNRAVAGVREAARKGAKVVVLPELFRSRYFCQSEDAAHFGLAEAIPGPSTETFAALAKELGVAIVASLFEKRAAGLYHNTAAVLDADGAVRVVASDTRSQRQNRALAEERLAALIRRALVVPKVRRKTKPGRSAVERRLSEKRLHSAKKRDRRGRPDE